jgi:hypothetical protein
MAKVYDNSGSLAKNDRKEKETHPDIRGKATVAGVEYWVDGWRKDGEKGPWYSLSFKPKDKEAPAKPARKVSGDGIEDDIPF